MNSFNSLDYRRRCYREHNNQTARADFVIELNNKWLCLTAVSLFWEI